MDSTGDATIDQLPSILAALTGADEVVVFKGGKTYKGTLSDILTYISAQNITFRGNITQALTKTITIGAGANQRAGKAVLVAGTIDVANTTITSNSIVLLTNIQPGGTPGILSYSNTVGAKVTINSTSATDTSTVAYFIFELA